MPFPLALALLGAGAASTGASMWANRGNRGNPATAAQPYLDRVPGYGREAYQPFIDRGRQAEQRVSPIYQRMSQDPQGYLNELMGGYQESPGAQYQMGRGMDAARAAAASTGTAGGTEDQRRRMEMASGIVGQDRQQYLNNLLGMQGSGLQGEERRIGEGFNASGSLADYLGTAAGNQANLAYQGRAQKIKNRNQALSSFGNLAGGLASLIGGGGAGAGMAAMSGMTPQTSAQGGGMGMGEQMPVNYMQQLGGNTGAPSPYGSQNDFMNALMQMMGGAGTRRGDGRDDEERAQRSAPGGYRSLRNIQSRSAMPRSAIPGRNT